MCYSFTKSTKGVYMLTQNRPLLKRRTLSGNISLGVFRNTAVNRETNQEFTTDNVAIQTGYFDKKTQKWVNSTIYVPLDHCANLAVGLQSLIMSVMAQPAPQQTQAPQAQAPQVLANQPGSTPFDPANSEDPPF